MKRNVVTDLFIKVFLSTIILALWGALIFATSKFVYASEHRSQAVLHQFQKLHPCPATGLRTGACPGYVKDHVYPLCAGGADAVDNLQWQMVTDAHIKDKWEWSLCRGMKQ